MSRWLSQIKRVDWWLVVPTAYLIALGFLVQHAILFKTKGVELDYSLNAHIGAIVISFAVAIVATYFSPKKWLRSFWFIYGFGIITLVILAATVSSEAERWVSIGGFRFQPTEIMKIAVIGVLANEIAKYRPKMSSMKTIIKSLAIVGLPTLLVAVQPDLGSSVVFVLIWVVMLVSSQVRLMGLGVVGLIFAAMFLLSLPLLAPYQQDRISSFLNPAEDEQGTAYNSIQASIAIGSGGLLGNGLDSGTQSQLNFLPAQHTDFAFAVTAEKLGLIGAITVVVAFGFLLIRMSYLAYITNNMYWRLLIVGVVAMFLAHVLINIGMNVGLLPVTGLPLPFISYGGTFLFVSLTSVLMIVIISDYIAKERDNRNKILS